MNLVNLTPHEINVGVDGTRIAIPSDGNCRVSIKQVGIERLILLSKSVPLMQNQYGNVEGLPEPKKDTIYIVSLMVLNALAGIRDDIIAPDSGTTAIREDGKIVAVSQFVRN